MRARLMMAGSIESAGRWDCPETACSDTDALADLAGRLHRATGKPEAKLRDALTWAAEQKNIACERENGQIRWQWVDRLAAGPI